MKIKSNGQIETAPCESFIGQYDLNVIFLGLFFLFLLQFFFLLYEELFLVVLQLFLKSFKLNVVFFHCFFIIVDLLLHGSDLPLFLLQILFVNWYHFFLLNRGLSFQNLLQGFQLLFFLFEVSFFLFDFFSF